MKTVRPDSKGRILLGQSITHGISSFSVEKRATGEIILRPYVEIPASEQWIHKNPKGLASLQRGFEDIKEGRLVTRKIPKITEEE